MDHGQGVVHHYLRRALHLGDDGLLFNPLHLNGFLKLRDPKALQKTSLCQTDANTSKQSWRMGVKYSKSSTRSRKRGL